MGTGGEVLRRAGLERVGGRADVGVPPGRAVWRMVGAGGPGPVTVVRSDVGEVNARWHRLAVRHGILDESGVFLVEASGEWTPVRLAGAWDLAGVLGARFLTLSADGRTLLAVGTDGGGVRLTVVDRFDERWEAAVRTAGRETPQERAAVWASVENGALFAEGAEWPAESWVVGLALNPATPTDVLVGLMSRPAAMPWPGLPQAAVDAAVSHPDWTVRCGVAEHRSGLTADQWARLILDEPNDRRRWLMSWIAADRQAALPGSAVRRLAADPSARVRAEAARFPGLDGPTAAVLAADPDGSVRAVACRHGRPHLDGAARRALLADPVRKVRAEALLNRYREHPMPRSVLSPEAPGTPESPEAPGTPEGIAGIEGFEERAVESCRLARDLAEELVRDGDPARRRALARNPYLDRDLVAGLAEDPDEGVRFEVSVRPDLTEEQRARVRVEFDASLHGRTLGWVTALHGDPGAMRRLAASAHPLVRRSVARARHLPPDVVARLARDEDRVVQLFLAESCDDAPAELLLDVWLWWTGSLSTPDRPHGHPNFPRAGLLRYADDPNPRLRRLALDDPASTADLVERLGRDAAEEVRYRAASDPRLPAASAVRLLDDPRPGVRHAAARNPRLPAAVLLGLLRDPDTAAAAAGNPGLPVQVLRALGRQAGKPLRPEG
ncbi:PE-PGRS family protein [Kitasatospora sp. NPDC091207]|uniref:PE-PGRS family protein n=1 Tax=Kitasatospora sp. NPDC091207 TaxID=3364083 RepID=UPI003821C37B